MHHIKNYTNKIFPYGDMLLRTRKTARKSTGPIGVPHHQLAPRHEDSSSGSNDPIGDLEAQVEQLRTELHHRNDVRVEDSQRINELRTDIRHLQDQLAKRDLALNWVVNSRSLAWAKEAKARARVEEVHVLYS
jgi:chromosome segregation ATPase